MKQWESWAHSVWGGGCRVVRWWRCRERWGDRVQRESERGEERSDVVIKG